MIKPPNETQKTELTDAGNGRPLSPAAQRALSEAAARRAQQEKSQKAAPKEVGGREGPDPARYGDWEKGGIISDF